MQQATHTPGNTMKTTALLIPFLAAWTHLARAADLTYPIVIATTDSGKIWNSLLGETLWQSFGARQPFQTEETSIINAWPGGKSTREKRLGVKEGSTAELPMGPAKLLLKLQDFSPSSYKFSLSTENWDPKKILLPDPAGATLEISVDAERAFTIMTITLKGLPDGMPEAGQGCLSHVLPVFAGNLKTLVETGKPMLAAPAAPAPGQSAPDKP